MTEGEPDAGNEPESLAEAICNTLDVEVDPVKDVQELRGRGGRHD